MIIHDLYKRVNVPPIRRCISCFNIIILLHLLTKDVAADENKICESPISMPSKSISFRN